MPARRVSAVDVAVMLLLVVAGAATGVWSVALVPLRLPGGVEGLALVVGVLSTAGLGVLGGWATGSLLTTAAPGVGWVVAVVVLSLPRREGDVVVPGRLPTDPGVGHVGTVLLLSGVVGAGLALAWTTRRRLADGARPAASPPA